MGKRPSGELEAAVSPGLKAFFAGAPPVPRSQGPSRGRSHLSRTRRHYRQVRTAAAGSARGGINPGRRLVTPQTWQGRANPASTSSSPTAGRSNLQLAKHRKLPSSDRPPLPCRSTLCGPPLRVRVVRMSSQNRLCRGDLRLVKAVAHAEAWHRHARMRIALRNPTHMISRQPFLNRAASRRESGRVIA